jgi:hypothetical protein
MTYTLTINIDNPGLTQIASAGEYVTIMQLVTPYAQSTTASSVRVSDVAAIPTAVAWVAFTPFNSNTVTWSDSYAIFASNGAPAVGSAITMNSQTSGAAQLGWTYTLQSGRFTGQSGSGSGYIVANQQTGTSGGIYFGLATQPTINNTPQGLLPMNAFYVAYNQNGWFLPTQQISIFVSTCQTSGSAIPVLGGGTLIDFSNTSSATVQFDDATNSFVQQ